MTSTVPGHRHAVRSLSHGEATVRSADSEPQFGSPGPGARVTVRTVRYGTVLVTPGAVSEMGQCRRRATAGSGRLVGPPGSATARPPGHPEFSLKSLKGTVLDFKFQYGNLRY